MNQKPNGKVLFVVAPAPAGEAPTVMLGITPDAWEYMKDGRTHTFDLTKVGAPIKIILFGEKSDEEIEKTVREVAAAKGINIIDRRNEDHGIKKPKSH